MGAPREPDQEPTPAALSARILARAARAFGGRRVDEPVRARRAIVFLGKPSGAAIADGVDEDRAQAAIDALDLGVMPAPEELAALEACIRFMRAAWFVRDDRIRDKSGEPLPAEARAAIERWLPGVAAIRGVREGREVPIGTGFLVSPGVLLTAGHVAAVIAPCGAVAPGTTAHFDLEDGRVERRASVVVREVLARHAGEDVALLGLDGEGPLPGGLPLAAAPVVDAGAGLVVVGHPARDGRSPLFMDAVFDGTYEVKRASPGEALARATTRLYHDASTLGGNSGSPVFDREGRVVAVHVSGTFADRNESVMVSAAAADAAFSRRVATWV